MQNIINDIEKQWFNPVDQMNSEQTQSPQIQVQVSVEQPQQGSWLWTGAKVAAVVGAMALAYKLGSELSSYGVAEKAGKMSQDLIEHICSQSENYVACTEYFTKYYENYFQGPKANFLSAASTDLVLAGPLAVQAPTVSGFLGSAQNLLGKAQDALTIITNTFRGKGPIEKIVTQGLLDQASGYTSWGESFDSLVTSTKVTLYGIGIGAASWGLSYLVVPALKLATLPFRYR